MLWLFSVDYVINNAVQPEIRTPQERIDWDRTESAVDSEIL